MSNEFSFPWEGTTVGDAGAYSDDFFASVQARLSAYDGTNAAYGVVRACLDEYEVLATSPASAQITVSSGAALIQGRWSYNDGDQTFTIGANSSGNPRIDAVILNVDYVNQEVRIDVLAGTPAVSPSIPALTQVADVQWQIYLARIAVASGFTSIAQSTITDMRTWVNLPNGEGVNVTNNSGSILEKGNVVVLDTPATNVIRVTTSAATVMPNPIFGVMETRTAASGGLGRVIRSGVTPVICDGAVSLGDKLYASTSAAGQASNTAPFDPNNSAFGVVIAANSGAGTPCVAYVDCAARFKTTEPVNFLAYRSGNQAIGGASTVKVQLNAEAVDRGGYFDSATNYRFTPLIAGLYLFTGYVQCTVTCRSLLYLNGASYIKGDLSVSGTDVAILQPVVISMNGSTDYVELYTTVGGASNVTGTTAPYTTFLQGVLLTRL